jgi:hypothetical protein
VRGDKRKLNLIPGSLQFAPPAAGLPKLKEQDIDRLNKYVLAYHKLNSIKNKAESG